MLRALLVAYAFPPVGGAGVQRVVKLTKYLPSHGVAPTVLTAKNASVPLHDASLERDVPASVTVLRARTFEPGYGVKRAAWAASAAAEEPTLVHRLAGKLAALGRQVLVPDPQILWQPDAQRVLVSQLWGEGTDVVFITAPPFSQFLLAPLARLRRGTAVVLDYRDEWTTYRTTYEMMGSLAARVGDALEGALVRRAHAVTTATEAFREKLLERFPALDPGRVHAIPNGYDPDDFSGTLPAPPSDRLRLTYAGTIFKLTSARGLLGAVRRLHAAEPDLAKHLEVRFIGRIVDTEEPSFAGSEALGVVRMGYVEHEQVLRELAASHMVLCLLDEVPGAERIYPAKVFELMRLGRPCLTLAPPGALRDLAVEHRLGDVLSPRDEPGIAALLAERLRAFVAGRVVVQSLATGIERFDRRALAGEFAAVFRQAQADARRSGEPRGVGFTT